MKTLINVLFVLFVLFGSVVPASAQDQSVPETATVQTEQDQTVPATVQSEQDQTVPTVHVTVPSQGATVTDIVLIFCALVGFLTFVAGIVNFIVSRSEGRIEKRFDKVDKAQEKNDNVHEKIVERLEGIRTDLEQIKGWIRGWTAANKQNRSDDA